MKTIMKKQRGAILVMTALLVILLLGMAALALDLGRLYVLKTEMQNAADTAARAGAMELDGESGARMRAVAAIKDLLQHEAHFSSNPELLNQLSYIEGSPSLSPIIFYSWIGSSYDLETNKPANYCANELDGIWLADPDPDRSGKCVTTSDHNAHYVEVRLYPELVNEGDNVFYEIELFFLPVLGVLIDDVARVASVRARAVAGAGIETCNLMPLLICNPGEDPSNELVPGQLVLLKEHSGGGTWQPGNFGYLEPPTLTGQPRDLAYALADESQGGCSPPYITTRTGNIASFPRHGLNTRFGIYYDNITWVGGEEAYPPAPNVINYPRDDNFTELIHQKKNTCEFSPEDRFGNNNPDGDGLVVTEDIKCTATYSLDDYHNNYHTGTSPGLSTRYEYYQWELGVDPATSNWDWFLSPPGSPLRTPKLEDATVLNDLNEDICFADKGNKYIDPAKDLCRILDGDPATTAMGSPTPAPGLPGRRIIYVVMLNCIEHGPITGTTRDLYVGPGVGQFAKFFLTEHVASPPDVDVYAEFISVVEGDELQHLIHNQIQLYE